MTLRPRITRELISQLAQSLTMSRAINNHAAEKTKREQNILRASTAQLQLADQYQEAMAILRFEQQNETPYGHPKDCKLAKLLERKIRSRERTAAPRLESTSVFRTGNHSNYSYTTKTDPAWEMRKESEDFLPQNPGKSKKRKAPVKRKSSKPSTSKKPGRKGRPKKTSQQPSQ